MKLTRNPPPPHCPGPPAVALQVPEDPVTGPGYGPRPTAQGVRGYRDIPDDQVALINSVKLVEEDVARMWGAVERDSRNDPRWLDIARTHFQEAFSALVRSIAQPHDPFQAALTSNQQDEAEHVIPRRTP